jgi:pSer/pThr/pTyr-binding forkhead associated (FHA) protein
MQVVLVMFRSDGERRSFSVVRNMTVIGRREDCDLRIPVGDVSRKHCRLVRTDDGIRIEDLGSSNGTYVNGQRIQESELNAGDQVGVGPVQFVVQINGMPADDEIAAPAAAVMDPEDSSAPLAPTYMTSPQAEETEEFPLEELPVDEAPLEEVASDEMKFGEDEPAAHTEEEEFKLEEVEEPIVPVTRRPSVPPPPRPPEPEMALEEAPLEGSPVEEAALEEEPLELAAGAGHAESEIEHVNLEEPATEGEPAAAAPAEGDWDFVVGEGEAEAGHDDFHIDLDSPHQQPHQ